MSYFDDLKRMFTGDEKSVTATVLTGATHGNKFTLGSNPQSQVSFDDLLKAEVFAVLPLNATTGHSTNVGPFKQTVAEILEDIQQWDTGGRSILNSNFSVPWDPALNNFHRMANSPGPLNLSTDGVSKVVAMEVTIKAPQLSPQSSVNILVTIIDPMLADPIYVLRATLNLDKNNEGKFFLLPFTTDKNVVFSNVGGSPYALELSAVAQQTAAPAYSVLPFKTGGSTPSIYSIVVDGISPADGPSTVVTTRMMFSGRYITNAIIANLSTWLLNSTVEVGSRSSGV